MTISIQVSVNGNYKAPVKITRQDGTVENHVVSGFGQPGPNILYVPYYHGSNDGVVTVEVGPESQDNGEAEGS